MNLEKPTKLQTNEVRIQLLRANQTVRDLALTLGISVSTLRFHMSTNFVRGRRIALKIEDALNVAIWSTNEEFQHRQAVTAFFGVDPFVMTDTALRDLAKKLGVSLSGVPRWRRAVFAALMDFFSRNQGAKRHSGSSPAESLNLKSRKERSRQINQKQKK